MHIMNPSLTSKAADDFLRIDNDPPPRLRTAYVHLFKTLPLPHLPPQPYPIPTLTPTPHQVLYLLTTHLLLPTYHRLLRHRTYILLPTTHSPPSTQGLLTRLSNLLNRSSPNNFSSAESLLGDEELEEGFGELAHSISAQERDSRIAEAAGETEGRLSQELERGFRDSSDEEEGDERGRR